MGDQASISLVEQGHDWEVVLEEYISMEKRILVLSMGRKAMKHQTEQEHVVVGVVEVVEVVTVLVTAEFLVQELSVREQRMILRQRQLSARICCCCWG